MKKLFLSAALALILSTAGVYAEGSAILDPPKVCARGDVAALRKAAEENKAKIIETVDTDAVKAFAAASVEKFHAPESALAAASYILIEMEGNPLTGVYFFDRDRCYITGANLPRQAVNALLAGLGAGA